MSRLEVALTPVDLNEVFEDVSYNWGVGFFLEGLTLCEATYAFLVEDEDLREGDPFWVVWVKEMNWSWGFYSPDELEGLRTWAKDGEPDSPHVHLLRAHDLLVQRLGRPVI